MRAREFIVEGVVNSKIIADNIGGKIKLTPDPSLYSSIEKFSISYINDNMAIFYKVNNRIIGLDSHGHTGKPEPHLHLLQKSKRKGFIQINIEKLDFKLARHLFYNLLFIMKKKYMRDKNARI